MYELILALNYTVLSNPNTILAIVLPHLFSLLIGYVYHAFDHQSGRAGIEQRG